MWDLLIQLIICHNYEHIISAHSLHSLEACNIYTKRVLMKWNGRKSCQ